MIWETASPRTHKPKIVNESLNTYAVALMVIDKMFKIFPIICLRELLIPRDVASLHPRGLIGRIYVGDH